MIWREKRKRCSYLTRGYPRPKPNDKNRSKKTDSCWVLLLIYVTFISQYECKLNIDLVKKYISSRMGWDIVGFID